MYRLPPLLLRLLSMVLVLGLGAGAAAAGQPALLEQMARLKPGQFVWQPERAAEGPVGIVIILPRQIAYVFRGGTLIGASTISSGKPGNDSPVGPFVILEKRLMHRSNRYSNAPMPFMQRLNWHGVALHAGEISGRPASHGCIRLPHAFAKKLFTATSVGSFVFVTEETVPSPEAALQLAHANAHVPLTADRAPRSSSSLASK
jgi:hypothetical protein